MARNDVERAVARLAARQDGVAARAQLLACGLSAKEIKTRIGHGHLVVVYRGVYALGHGALSDRGRAWAATLAAGPHSAASRATAVALYGLTRSMPAVLDVSLTRGDRRSRAGLRVHHGLEPGDVTRLRGLPVTTPLRTLADLGFPERPTREALARDLVRPEDLPVIVEAANDFEERMRTLIARAGLPQPVAQYRLNGFRLDFAWPDHRVAVETDGWATHGRRQGFEDDRARDAVLLAAGWRTLRVTYRRLRREPMLVAAQLSAVLARAAA